MMKTDLFVEQAFLKERKADGLEDRLGEIARSNGEILRADPADEMKAAVAAKLANRKGAGIGPRAFPAWKYATFAAAACLTLLVSVFIVHVSPIGEQTAPSGLLRGMDRAKGSGPRLRVYRKNGNEAVRIETGTRVAEGDVLQLSYQAGGAEWGAIVSIDGNGTVTRHFPDTGDEAGRLENDGEIALDFSYELDNAPRFERFIFITGGYRFSVSAFEQEIANLVRGGLPGSIDLTVFLPSRTNATDILLIK